MPRETSKLNVQDGSARKVAHSLRWRYIVALTLVATLSTAAWFSLHLVIKAQESSAAIINVSGRQRMLSQRIALFSNLLVNASPEKRWPIRETLGSAIDLMRQSHQGLTHGSIAMGLPENMSEAVRSMYYTGSDPLDKLVKDYLESARLLLNQPDNALNRENPQLHNITAIGPTQLLTSLDRMVKQYQSEGEATVQHLQKIETAFWITTLLLLLLEAGLIFQPFSNHLKLVIEQLQKVSEELRAHELELTRKATALEEAKQQAEAANVAKSAFLANMSHELRTPLNGVLGMAQLVRRGGVTPKQADQLDKLDAAGRHLVEIINDILDLSKIEAGKLILEETEVHLDAIAADVMAMLGPSAEIKHIQLLFENPHLHSGLLGDPTRLKQALLNYASNAVKFTENGIVAMRTQVEEETPDDVLIRFEVEDTGIGIDPTVADRLFQSFQQADNSSTRKYGGTGLGLVITKKLAELMGGTSGVSSTPGTGSTFWFTARLKKP